MGVDAETKVIEFKETTKQDFKLVPLYNTNAVLKNWHHFSEGLEMVLAHTIGNTNLTVVLNEALAGELLLWIGFLDGIYCGFVTTKIEQAVLKDIAGVKKFLSVIHLYIKKGTDKQIFIDWFNLLNDFAKRMKCDELRMWSPRDGWEKKLDKLGWNKTYVEYVLEVK